VGYQFEHRFDDVWSFRQNFRYMHVDGDLNQVLPLAMLDDRTMERYALQVHDNLDAVTLDNQVQANFATGPLRHKLLMGLDFQNTTLDESQGQALAPDLDIFAPVYYQAIPIPPTVSDTHQRTYQVGLYAQDQIRLGRLALMLGGREDWAGTTTDDRVAQSSASQFDRKFTYRAGAVYLFDNGLAPYASYTTSFQPQIGTEASGSAFKPTTGQQVEVGMKYQPPGYNSFVTLSAYQLTQQNVPTADPNNPAFQVQTGEVRTRGVEVEAHANLLPGFNIIASYGYADPVVTKSTSGNLGKVPVNVPRQLASLWSDYTVQNGKLTGLGLGGGVRFVGTTFGDTANTLRVPSYALFDAALTYDFAGVSPRLKGWRLAVNASNLFDKQYVSECSNTAYCLYGLRRTVLANLRFRW
ncbi:MAG TPA: TonB-dependent siderophore receptor, partial [Rhodopila sp.]